METYTQRRFYIFNQFHPPAHQGAHPITPLKRGRISSADEIATETVHVFSATPNKKRIIYTIFAEELKAVVFT